jgi:tetratricopeptide (TPR) repeat protein
MASKNKKSGRGGTPATGGRQEVERLIAKLRLKDAVHEAKLCYKSESTPENHRLLERAYLLRADQLHRNAMPSGAREVVQHLLDFGVTDPALVDETARLLNALGMPRSALAVQGRLESPEEREKLARQELDVAVLHPDRSVELPKEAHDGAALVRGALEALQAGDEARALEALRDVARSSPLSDWKLFLRGMAAFSRRQNDEARANWDRLDPDRAAARIARSLLALSLSESDSSAGSLKLVALERQIFGEPILDKLELLKNDVANNGWAGALRQVAWLRPRLRRIDPKLAQRLTAVLLHPLTSAVEDLNDYEDVEELVEGFTRVAEPLDIDPRWNRLWALVWEGPRGTIEGLEEYWRDYLKDLETAASFQPQERTLAQALVWNRLAEGYLDSARDLVEEPFTRVPAERRRQEAEGMRLQAIGCLKESLRLDPENRSTHWDLVQSQVERGRPEEAAAAARRLLERFPDDFETLDFLVDYHFGREEPDPALDYVLRARKLKPLDGAVAKNEWAVRVSRARSLALQGRFDEGRAEFAAAERAAPQASQSLHYKARRAILELKAGQTERGEALIADLQESLSEPTPLWLALLIEATRYKLPQADRGRFDAHWTTAQSRRIRGETAGALADLMASFVAGNMMYEGRDAHVVQVAGYLRRTTRTKYRLDDLKKVCAFLGLLPKEQALHAKLVARGLKLFPKAPTFLALAGAMEVQKGPFAGGNLVRAREYYEKALPLAQASPDPDDARLVSAIQQALSMIKDMRSGPMGLPFGLPSGGFGGRSAPFPGGPEEFAATLDAMARSMGIDPDDMYDDEFDDDFDDELGDEFFEDDADDAPARPRALPGGKPKSKKQKQKRKRKKG